MPGDWKFRILHQEARPRRLILEGRARGPEHADADDAVEFSLTLYATRPP